MPQKINRVHCAVIRPDHFKFASYGPVWSKPLCCPPSARTGGGGGVVGHTIDRCIRRRLCFGFCMALNHSQTQLHCL